MNSFLAYLGGKSKLSKTIISMMPEHQCYCEVFAGAAWVLFKKEESEVEIINDLNSDLVNLYRVIKFHLDEFIRYLRWILTARDEFDRFKKENPEALTDVQRAVRFYYLLKNSYGSKVAENVFNVSVTRRPKINLLRIEEELSAAHLRLSRVYIENKSYDAFIPRYDRPETLFYIDPPYHGCEDYYGKNMFSEEDFGKLAGILSELKGKFLLSINDTPFIRDTFGQFDINEVKTTYSVSGRSKKVGELLIKNY